VTPDRRNATKHGPFTTWQWAVLGSYFVAIVLAVSVYKLANRADENANRGNAAICVEVAFLHNSLVATERLIQQSPQTPESAARKMSARRLRELVDRLEAEVPNCRTALK
jgi:hypothetical protein